LVEYMCRHQLDIDEDKVSYFLIYITKVHVPNARDVGDELT